MSVAMILSHPPTEQGGPGSKGQGSLSSSSSSSGNGNGNGSSSCNEDGKHNQRKA